MTESNSTPRYTLGVAPPDLLSLTNYHLPTNERALSLLKEPQMDTAVRTRPEARPSRTSLVVGLVLLTLATIHCAASLFFVNYSYLDLKSYAAGTERMPYQGRIGMMPLLQLAQHSPSFIHFSAKISRSLGSHEHSAFQSITLEGLACMIAALVSLLISVGVAAIYGIRKFAATWWMPPVLLLGMLYVTQGARYETALWYPYDLPHAALFGTACLLVMEGAWIPVLLVFLIDLPVRETGIFLVPLCVAVGWARGQFKQALAISGVMLAVWIPFRIYIRHRFSGNPSELGIHYTSTLAVIMSPIHWPQIASAFGFLLIPLCLGNRLLSKSQRAFMLGAFPCLLVTLAFGIWPETRIFGEWLLPAAVLLTAESLRLINPQSPVLSSV